MFNGVVQVLLQRVAVTATVERVHSQHWHFPLVTCMYKVVQGRDALPVVQFLVRQLEGSMLSVL